MERSNFFTDQDVLQEDLNNIETTKIQQLKYRSQYILGRSENIYHQSDSTATASVVRGGIYWNIPSPGLGGEGNYIDTSFYVQYATPTSLRVYAGAALSPEGEFMLNPATLTMTKGSSGANYDWNTPSLGPSFWYVKLYYNEISGSIKANDLGVSYPTRYTDDFWISVNLTPPSANEILLASFLGNMTGDITTGSLKDERSYVRIITPANAVLLDPSTVPVAAFENVEDHVNAVGTGIPSATNPHGLTGNDIGLSDTTAPHRNEAHIPGIIDITGEYPDTTSFRNSYLGVPYDVGAVAGINWTTPDTNAYIMVKGAPYKPTLDTVNFTTHPDVVAGGYDKYYTFYYEGSGSVVRATTGSIQPFELPGSYWKSDKFVLCRVAITDGGSAYANFEDYRKFYVTSQVNIRGEWYPNGSDPLGQEAQNWVSLSNKMTLWDNLNRIRYKLALALNGSDWAGDNPLTAGTNSDAYAYHYHSGTPRYYFSLNVAREFTNIYLNFCRYGVAYNASLAWINAVQRFAFFSDITSSFYGPIHVGALYVGQASPYLLTPTHVAAMPTLTGGPASDADAYHTHYVTEMSVLTGGVSSDADAYHYHSSHTTVTGSIIATAIEQVRYNPSHNVLHVYCNIETGLAQTVIACVSNTSGSVAAEGTDTIVCKTEVGTASYGFVSCVVPPHWYYKIASAGTPNRATVVEYPPKSTLATGGEPAE